MRLIQGCVAYRRALRDLSARLRRLICYESRRLLERKRRHLRMSIRPTCFFAKFEDVGPQNVRGKPTENEVSIDVNLVTKSRLAVQAVIMKHGIVNRKRETVFG